MPTSNRSSHGFTLIEILISLSIVAVLFVFAIPVGRDFIINNRVSAQTEEIVSALHYARHQAALLGKSLTLTHPEEGGWSAGMILFNSEQTVFQWDWNNADIAITWNGLNKDTLLFAPNGLHSALAGSFYICSLNNANNIQTVNSTISGKKISMNRLGRITVEDDKEICNT